MAKAADVARGGSTALASKTLLSALVSGFHTFYVATYVRELHYSLT